MVECCILIPQYALIVQWCGLISGVEKVDQVDWLDDFGKLNNDKDKVDEVDKMVKDMLEKDQVDNLDVDNN